ncbi:MAG TPA: nicotinamide riboside transporter PnuC [Blastocatellia bacterium]|nr:nicotinamide riboside transporter PnuC [Blastocatellia bacterium]
MNLRTFLEILIAITVSTVFISGSLQGWFPVSLTETLGFITGAACVYLVVKENIWNYPLGIANNIFFIVLFTNTQLYGDAALQLVYIALGIQGWYLWLHGGPQKTVLKVNSASLELLVYTAVFVVVGTIALIYLLRWARGAAPFLDAFTTALSLAAQYLLNRKMIENWYLWITADVIYIFLYISRGLHLTAVLYFIFLCLCIAGVMKWRQSLRLKLVVGRR